MNVEGLTSAHIKSHLQKYRRGLQRRKDGGGNDSISDSGLITSSHASDTPAEDNVEDPDPSDESKPLELWSPMSGLKPFPKTTLADFGQTSLFQVSAFKKSDSGEEIETDRNCPCDVSFEDNDQQNEVVQAKHNVFRSSGLEKIADMGASSTMENSGRATARLLRELDNLSVPQHQFLPNLTQLNIARSLSRLEELRNNEKKKDIPSPSFSGKLDTNSSNAASRSLMNGRYASGILVPGAGMQTHQEVGPAPDTNRSSGGGAGFASQSLQQKNGAAEVTEADRKKAEALIDMLSSMVGKPKSGMRLQQPDSLQGISNVMEAGSSTMPCRYTSAFPGIHNPMSRMEGVEPPLSMAATPSSALESIPIAMDSVVKAIREQARLQRDLAKSSEAAASQLDQLRWTLEFALARMPSQLVNSEHMGMKQPDFNATYGSSLLNGKGRKAP